MVHKHDMANMSTCAPPHSNKQASKLIKNLATKVIDGFTWHACSVDVAPGAGCTACGFWWPRSASGIVHRQARPQACELETFSRAIGGPA